MLVYRQCVGVTQTHEAARKENKKIESKIRTINVNSINAL